MTTVDELFAAMDAPKVVRVILTIDENLRIIDIPNLAVVIGAEGDKDVNRLYFKMDRLYRGTDLAAFTPRINYINAAGKNYYYDATDLTVEGDSLTFSWLIRAQAAEVSGTVEFSVCMRQYAEKELVAEFNTTTSSIRSIPEHLRCWTRRSSTRRCLDKDDERCKTWTIRNTISGQGSAFMLPSSMAWTTPSLSLQKR